VPASLEKAEQFTAELEGPPIQAVATAAAADSPRFGIELQLPPAGLAGQSAWVPSFFPAGLQPPGVPRREGLGCRKRQPILKKPAEAAINGGRPLPGCTPQKRSTTKVRSEPPARPQLQGRWAISPSRFHQTAALRPLQPKGPQVGPSPTEMKSPSLTTGRRVPVAQSRMLARISHDSGKHPHQVQRGSRQLRVPGQAL